MSFEIKLTGHQKVAILFLMVVNTSMNFIGNVATALWFDICFSIWGWYDLTNFSLIMLTATLVSAAASPFWGAFCDKHRKAALLSATSLWGSSMFLFGLAYYVLPVISPMFFLFVLILDYCGLAGFIPAVGATLSDMAPETSRNRLHFLITGPGLLVGILTFFLSGFFSSSFQALFLAGGITVIAVSVVYAFAIPSSAHSMAASERALAELIRKEQIPYARTFKLASLRSIFTNKVNMLTMIEGLIGAIFWSIIFNLLMPWLRESHVNGGLDMDPITAGVWAGLTMGIPPLLGVMIFGVLGDRSVKKLREKNSPSPNSGLVKLVLIGQLLAYPSWAMIFIIPYPIGMQIPDFFVNWQFLLALALAWTSNISYQSYNANQSNALVAINEPEQRASLVAWDGLFTRISSAIGPFIAALIFSTIGNYELTIFTNVLIGAAVIPFWFIIYKLYPAEEARFQSKMQRIAEEMRSNGGLSKND